jgi:prepilin-type N-terminal cleavage/methylation domain-containing protein
MKQGFTLIELLVVISITGIMMGIMLPAVSRAREKAKVTAVDAELRQIGIVLEMYFDDNQKFPPTQEDCATGKLTDHLYQLPTVLVTSHYLPSMPRTEAMSTKIEDRFNRGHTYKYRSVGEVIKDRNIIDRWIKARIWIPDNFPVSSSIDPNKGRWRPDPNESTRYSESKSSLALLLPVSWVVFSLGPRFSERWLEEKLGLENRYPVPKELWYSPKERRGFIVRMRLKNGSQIGSFGGSM